MKKKQWMSLLLMGTLALSALGLSGCGGRETGSATEFSWWITQTDGAENVMTSMRTIQQCNGSTSSIGTVSQARLEKRERVQTSSSPFGSGSRFRAG